MSSLNVYDFSQLLEFSGEFGSGPKPNESSDNPPHDLVLRVRMTREGNVLGHVKCHRLLLSIMSNVFNRLCYHSVSDPSRPEEVRMYDTFVQLDIIGYDLATVKLVLMYLHTGDEAPLDDLDFEQLMDVYQFCHEYKLVGFRNKVGEKIRFKPIELDKWEAVMTIVLTRQEHQSLKPMCFDLGFRCARELQEHWMTTFDIISFLGKDPRCPKRQHILEILTNCAFCPKLNCQYHTISEMHSRCCLVEDTCTLHIPYSPEYHLCSQPSELFMSASS